MNDILRIGKVVYRVSDTEVLEVGTLTKELTNNIEMVYVLDIDKKRIDRLKERGIDVGVLLMPGVDLDDGYRQVFNKVPFFMSVRVPDRRREDIDDILKELGLEFYDPLEILLKTRGVSLDNWEIHEV